MARQRLPVCLYPPHTAAQALAVRDLVVRYRSINSAALGLLALGWPVSEQRVRAAYLAALEAREQFFKTIQRIIDAPADIAWDEAFGALADSLRRGRGFRPIRQAARVRRQSDGTTPPAADARWDQLEAITRVFIDGRLGSDAEVATLLAPFSPVQPPSADAVAVTRRLHRASSAKALTRVASTARIEEIERACEEIMVVALGVCVLIDGGFVLAEIPDERPAPLSALLPDDPLLLARLGLVLASVKRDTQVGPSLTTSLAGFAEASVEILPVVHAQLAGKLPHLEALTTRYLTGRRLRPSQASLPWTPNP